MITNTHPAGLALFAGIAAEPRADDLPGRAAQLVAILRELRGSVHLVAVVAVGLEPKVAHALRRPDMVSAFGYENVPDIEGAAAAKLAECDELTDRLLVPSYAPLTETQAGALLTGTNAIAAAFKAS